MVRRERDPYEDDYYYRHERREVGPYRGDRDYAVARYERRRRDDDYYSDDDDYYRRRTVVRRERSSSTHHKRHLAEGALAGAGITALMSSRRDEYGDLPENRGRKVLAGAALGALGTEALRRAHSAYEDRYGDGRESPDHHSRLKKGLGIAAVALAAAGAAKYYQSNKVEKEEARRGRSRTRGYHSGDDYSRSVSRVTRSRTRSRKRSISTVAKAALGTAATAGIIKHFRDKSRSKSRHGSRSRSKSMLRRGAEVASVAAAAGVANKLWKNHKDKKDARDYSPSDDGRDYDRRSRSRGVSRDRGMSRTRSRSRSMARSPHSPSRADPELGLVEYGNDPLPPEPSSSAARYHESQSEDKRRRRRRRRDLSGSPSPENLERKRSKSRMRDMAAAGAAALGIKEFKNRKDQEKRERRSRERRSRSRADDERRKSGTLALLETNEADIDFKDTTMNEGMTIADTVIISTITAHVHTLHPWHLAVPTIRPIHRLPAQHPGVRTTRRTPMLPALHLVSISRTCHKIIWAIYHLRLRARLRHLSPASVVDIHNRPRDLLIRDHLRQGHLHRGLHLLVGTTRQTM